MRHHDFSIRWNEVIPLSKCSKELKECYGGGFLISTEAWKKIKEINEDTGEHSELSDHDKLLVKEIDLAFA